MRSASSAAHCFFSGLGEIGSGDSFQGDGEINLDFTALGTWNHYGPEVAVACRHDNGRHLGWTRGRGHSDHGNGKGHGHRNHDHDGDGDCGTTHDELIGTVESGICTINGATVLQLFGTGTWNGVGGHTFAVFAKDGDASSPAFPDEYSIIVEDAVGNVVYDTGLPLDVVTSGDISAVVP